MGKSRNFRGRAEEETVWVALEDIYISEATWQKLLRREAQQIEHMRDQYENGCQMVRVVLHHRVDGGYTIEDGRHRVIAAKLAGVGFIEAIVVGD